MRGLFFNLSPYTLGPNRLSRNSIKDDDRPEFSKVAENLCRRTSTDAYYALLERGGKQFRRSLKTADRSLANRRLADLRKRIANLTLSDARNTTFEALAKSWLDGVRHALKPAGLSRREVCVKGLTPFFNLVPVVVGGTVQECGGRRHRPGVGCDGGVYRPEPGAGGVGGRSQGLPVERVWGGDGRATRGLAERQVDD